MLVAKYDFFFLSALDILNKIRPCRGEKTGLSVKLELRLTDCPGCTGNFTFSSSSTIEWLQKGFTLKKDYTNGDADRLNCIVKLLQVCLNGLSTCCRRTDGATFLTYFE